MQPGFTNEAVLKKKRILGVKKQLMKREANLKFDKKSS
jgi:hypothetical protein